MSQYYYAVARGRNPGVYDTWEECKNEVHQYSHSLFRKFSSLADAERFVEENSDSYVGSGYRGAESAYGYGSRQERSTYFYYSSSEDDEYTAPQEDYIVDRDGYVNVYTDGACISNGRDNPRAGIGVWFGDNHPMNVSKPLAGRATNNRAEIEAVTEAAKQARRAGITHLKINTDSKFLMSCIQHWMAKWKSNGWRTVNNEPVINKSELIRMEKALVYLNVKWRHVNSHAGVYGNEMADKLARAACSRN